MKFHWGTGITIFIFLFLGASAVFIAFALRQKVDLVHEDYYERGVDHTARMEEEQRSAVYSGQIQTQVEGNYLLISVNDSLVQGMDSARFRLYRPSDARLDLEGEFFAGQNPMAIARKELTMGRYILIFQWHSQGLPYEIQQTVILP